MTLVMESQTAGMQKAATNYRCSGFHDQQAAYSAVFLAGSFSLIRADLPLRSRR